MLYVFCKNSWNATCIGYRWSPTDTSKNENLFPMTIEMQSVVALKGERVWGLKHRRIGSHWHGIVCACEEQTSGVKGLKRVVALVSSDFSLGWWAVVCPSERQTSGTAPRQCRGPSVGGKHHFLFWWHIATFEMQRVVALKGKRVWEGWNVVALEAIGIFWIFLWDSMCMRRIDVGCERAKTRPHVESHWYPLIFCQG